jgi:putative tryptophan/tyrosine transport system substrate-binding protein
MLRRRDLVTLFAGMAVIGPGHVRAQGKPIPVIGFLSSTSPGTNAANLAAFRQGLSETGYVEGQT